MRIGFAGLGRMGRPMAAHLAEAGYRVVAYDPATLRPPTGVALTDSVDELAHASISISMLPDGDTTTGLVRANLIAADAGHIHIVMGTVGPDVVRDLAAQAGFHVIDAPVSGSVAMAEAGTLTTMIGATVEQYHAVQPVLASMTAAQFHAGPAGAGSAAKLAVNAVLAGLSQAVAEGLLLAERSGLDLDAFYEILRNSAAGAPYVGYKREAYLSPQNTPVAAPVSLIRKDLRLALELAEEQSLSLPGSRATFAVLEDAIASGLGDADMAEVLTVLRTGTETRSSETAFTSGASS